MRVVISSGHGKYIRGAAGPTGDPFLGLDEVDTVRVLVEEIARHLRAGGAEAVTFHDNTSRTQSENLNTIISFHNAQGPHDWDVSVHLNAYQVTEKPMGTEVCYLTQEEMAADLSLAIADAGDLIDRGAKYRGDLAFLNQCREKAVLIETVFCDSHTDCDLLRQHQNGICLAIAETLIGTSIVATPPQRPVRPPEMLFRTTGKCSWFGGPSDMGVGPEEGLAFYSEISQRPELFLPSEGRTAPGLARALNPHTHYVACRWDYDVTSKEMLRSGALALVRSPHTGYELTALPADWGPHEDTGRVADLSPGLLKDLGITTDDVVEVIFPWQEK